MKNCRKDYHRSGMPHAACHFCHGLSFDLSSDHFQKLSVFNSTVNVSFDIFTGNNGVYRSAGIGGNLYIPIIKIAVFNYRYVIFPGRDILSYKIFSFRIVTVFCFVGRRVICRGCCSFELKILSVRNGYISAVCESVVREDRIQLS